MARLGLIKFVMPDGSSIFQFEFFDSNFSCFPTNENETQYSYGPPGLYRQQPAIVQPPEYFDSDSDNESVESELEIVVCVDQGIE